jgi:nucleolar GTP-binding protein
VIETGCQQLLQQRVERKLAVSSKSKVDNVLNRLQVAMPTQRDNKQRGVSIPESVLKQRMLRAQQEAVAANAAENDEDGLGVDDDAMMDIKSSYTSLISNDYAKTAHTGVSKNSLYKTAKQIQNEHGGAGVFAFDWRIHWANTLHNPLFAYDVLPEIMDGKNVSDYIDPDIEQKLIELEKEEDLLAAEYDNSIAMMSDDSDLDADEKAAVQQIRDTKKLLLQHNSLRKSVANKPRVPRTVGYKDATQAATDLTEMGYDVEKFQERARSLSRVKSQKRKRLASEALGVSEDGDIEMNDAELNGNDVVDAEDRGNHRRGRAKVRALVREASRSRAVSEIRDKSQPPASGSKEMPFRDVKQKEAAQKVFQAKQKSRNVHEKTQRLGESDRRFFTKMPKHLFSGKRGIGKTDRR